MDNQRIWLVVSTPLKHMKVNWDDDIPSIWEIKHVPNHQPGIYDYLKLFEHISVPVYKLCS